MNIRHYMAVAKTHLRSSTYPYNRESKSANYFKSQTHQICNYNATLNSIKSRSLVGILIMKHRLALQMHRLQQTDNVR